MLDKFRHRRRWHRSTASVLLSVGALCATLASAPPAHAQPLDCNAFERIQSIILSEATQQPFAAQLEVARVVVTKGPCYLDAEFYRGLGQALRADARGDYANHHWRAYFDLYSFSPAQRESAAHAAHIALSESPRVPRYHFDAASAPRLWWWDSLRACPTGDFVIGEIRFC